MSDSDPLPPEISPVPPEPVKITEIAYESPLPDPGNYRRPRWVIAIVAIYLLTLLAILLAPAIYRVVASDADGAGILAITNSILVSCGLGLMIIPVRATRTRPITRRSFWIPVLCSGLLFAVLVLAAGTSIRTFFTGDDPDPLFVWVIVAAVIAWAFWAIIFLTIAFRRGPESIGMKLHNLLIAGSVLELLIAVPVHVIVRRRHLCCADIVTGACICLGIAIMLIALGPSVLLLFHRRRQQILGYRK